MLCSIHLNSNRPKAIRDFIKNIEDTSSKPSDIEVIINIDTADSACKKVIEGLQSKTKVNLKYIQTDIIKCYKDLWKPLNEILKLTNSKAYFVTNFSDEFRFETVGWDNILRKYINYYDDDIFRIRLSKYRYYNYRDYWECIFAPDSLAFYTKRWMDIVGQWCPCLGPDSWHQSVSYYLITAKKFNHTQYNRDIIDPFIKFSGEGASLGLKGDALKKRIRDNISLWFDTVSHEMQEKASYAAAKLQANIILHNLKDKQKISNGFSSTSKPLIFNNKDFNKISYENNKQKKRIEFYYQNELIYKIDYKLNKLKLFFLNNIRKLDYFYYAGGEDSNLIVKRIIKNFVKYLRLRYNILSVVIPKKPEFLKRNILSMLWPIAKIMLIFINISITTVRGSLCEFLKFVRIFRKL